MAHGPNSIDPHGSSNLGWYSPHINDGMVIIYTVDAASTTIVNATLRCRTTVTAGVERGVGVGATGAFKLMEDTSEQ